MTNTKSRATRFIICIVAYAVAAPSAVGLAGCGGETAVRSAGASGSSVAVHPGDAGKAKSTGQVGDRNGEPTGPGDADSDGGQGRYYDVDDRAITDFGIAADPAERSGIVSLLTHYYRAAVTGDGTTGCASLYSGFAEAVVEEHGEEALPGQVAGTTCPEVMSKIFKKNRRQFDKQEAKLRVLATRVEGVRGYAAMDVGAGYPLFVYLHREGGPWKLESVIATEMG